MSFLARKIPAWAIMLSVLATAGLFTLAFMTLPSLSDATQVNRDFSVTTTPSPVTVEQGSTVPSTVTITSFDSYNLATALTMTLSPATSMLTVALTPSVVTPTANARASSTMTIVAQPGTTIGTYTVALTATGGTKSHTTTITIIVVAVPDFSIAPSPASLTVFQNAANTTTLTLTSVGGFAGDVSLTLSAPFATIGVAGGGSPLHLASGGTNTTSLAVYPSSQTKPGSYTISVTGASGMLVHTVNISIMVKASGCNCGIEALNLEVYTFSNSTSAALFLRNNGTQPLSLVSYYVRDAQGDQYSRTLWSGPTISTNALATATINIGASCGTCTNSGSAFTFIFPQNYTVVLVTSKGDQVAFSISRDTSLTPQPPAPVGESLSFVTNSQLGSWTTNVTLDNSGSASLTLVSYYVKDSTGNLYALTSWSGSTITPGNAGTVTINIGAACGSCLLWGSAFSFIQFNYYTIIIITSHNNEFAFPIPPGTVSREALNLEIYSFNNSTSSTLYLRNSGSIPLGFASYYVKDTAGDQYARPTWAAGAPAWVVPHALATAYINIGASCPSCTLSGLPFTFSAAGGNYSIILVTSRGNQFVFTVNRSGNPPSPPTPVGESASVEFYSFYNGTMVAANIRNKGPGAVTLVTYYMRDSNGDTYSNTAWVGPSGIAPNSVNPTNFDINTTGNHCGGCTLSGGSAFTFSQGANYTLIFVTARDNEFIFKIGRGFPFTPPAPIGESIVLQSYSFSNSTSVTLSLHDSGSANVTLVTYYVQDASSNAYSRIAWTNGPTMSGNSTVSAYINIGASCGSCTNQGAAFTFVAGNSYRILIVTSKNNEFVFTITR